MITINKENQRGRGNHGWLKANYSFSFANYYNPKKMGFNDLLVINEDFIAPKGGFPPHQHQNMEILTVVLSGTLGHTDSMGNVKTLTPGKIQRMYAGTGVRHSEFNLSESEVLNLLQIWIKPNQANLPPEYEEKDFDLTKQFTLLASPKGNDQSIKAYTNAEVFLINLKAKETYSLNLDKQDTYLHTIKGDLLIPGGAIHYGDSVEITKEQNIKIQATTKGLILGFKFIS
jgi:redox-sensitive bicupin YhaK (pirin superfamily)